MCKHGFSSPGLSRFDGELNQRVHIMKAIFSPVFLVFIFSSIVLAQTAPHSASNVEQEIHQLDSLRVQAMIHADSSTLARVLADDLTYTHTNGRVDTKAQLIASLLSGRLTYETIDYEQSQLRNYGAAAVNTGLVTMKVNAGEQTLRFQARFTSVYVRQGEHWQMAAWQSTRMPD